MFVKIDIRVTEHEKAAVDKYTATFHVSFNNFAIDLFNEAIREASESKARLDPHKLFNEYASKKSSRLQVRVTPEMKIEIKKAATLSHMSVTMFFLTKLRHELMQGTLDKNSTAVYAKKRHKTPYTF